MSLPQAGAGSPASPMPETRRYLAIPFEGKDVPSKSSEFAHPDVTIGLTILAYRCKLQFCHIVTQEGFVNVLTDTCLVL